MRIENNLLKPIINKKLKANSRLVDDIEDNCAELLFDLEIDNNEIEMKIEWI